MWIKMFTHSKKRVVRRCKIKYPPLSHVSRYIKILLNTTFHQILMSSLNLINFINIKLIKKNLSSLMKCFSEFYFQFFLKLKKN
jgi:hypothetical protein